MSEREDRVRSGWQSDAGTGSGARAQSRGSGPLRSEVAPAIARAVAFLEIAQLPTGGFRILASTDPAMETGCAVDPSVFPNALIAHSLLACPSARALASRVRDFLRSEMDRHGLWRHWTRDHPQHAQLPPDLDDTSCASAALARAGDPVPPNREILLANRDQNGLFFTWIVPRPRWTGAAHRRVTLPQLLHLPTLFLFFRRTSADPDDVDAVVNANALFYLGRIAETEPVVEHVLRILREGQESQCDKWYENAFAVWYFFSRALAGSEAEAAELIERRIAETAPGNVLEASLAANSLLNLGRQPPNTLIDVLLTSQLPSGAWPRAALYHGGRARLRGGSFSAPHPDTPRWGSEELTTAFCIEALSRIAQTGA